MSPSCAPVAGPVAMSPPFFKPICLTDAAPVTMRALRLLPQAAMPLAPERCAGTMLGEIETETEGA